MSAYNYQPAELQDFSKGVTDDYMNGSLNAAAVLENFYILGNKSLKTRPGTVIDSLTDYQIPVGNQRINALISYDNGTKMFVHTGNKLYYRNPTTYTSLLGPTGNNPLNLMSTNQHIAHTQWNRHLMITSEAFDKPIKVYKDGAGVFQVRTAGLPKLASSPSAIGTAGVGSYLYAFCRIYEYQVGDQLFKDFGPLTLVQVSNVNAPDVNMISITGVAVLTNSSNDNYDTANIKVGIYRTINGGKELYKVTEITNGTTSYNDTMSDTTLQNNELIYTTGDIPDNDPPPLAKYCHTVNGVTYYAHLKVGAEIFKNKIRQSQALDPDSVPESFEDELDDEIVGLSSVQDIPIVGCKKYIYRIDGAFDSAGRGGMSHRRISDHAGCLSHDSFVQAEGLLFFFGLDGVYMTDGFRCTKVTDHLNASYKEFMATLVDKSRKVKGVYNEYTRTIYWTISRTSKASGQEECDAIFAIDLQWGVNDTMSCLYWVGGASFYPTSLVVHNGELYRGDRFGYVFRFDDKVFTDPKIINATAANLWPEETIRWTYKSVASNFGTSFLRKIANKILISSKNETNVSIAIKAINDDGKLTRNLTPIRWRRNFLWGDEEFVWGDPSFKWGAAGTIEVDRRFPSPGLRFNYLQMEITNDYSNIVNSDTRGLAALNNSLNTATLITASASWPTQSVDYYLYLEHDNFTKGYKVLSRTSTTLTLEDIDNTLPTGNYRWQLKGYRKGEALNLVGYSISWAPLSRSHDTFNTGDSGGLV